MDAKVAKHQVVPFSLKDAPSLIERIWPAQKISVEAQKERKAGPGQTLTALGSYWKGRKPVILVRACVLAALLPSTGDDEKDLAVFELLTGMSDEQLPARFKAALTASEIATYGTSAQKAALLEESEPGKQCLRLLPKGRRAELMVGVLARMPYQARVEKLIRPEEVSEDVLTEPHLAFVNKHLGTSAQSLPDLVGQLGIMRFGHRPIVGDTFCGGGSIPFEAGRLGCDVHASDLNPIACMLTWGAFNIIGGTKKQKDDLETSQRETLKKVDAEISNFCIEHDAHGNRAKSYLYCLETRCPQTGWLVPLSPSWVVSRTNSVIAELVPLPAEKRYDIKIRANVTAAEMIEAAKGTARDGRVVHSVDGIEYVTPIKSLRGDYKDDKGVTRNRLRLWGKLDFVALPDDTFRERLYAIQWMSKETLTQKRQLTFFAGVTPDDLARERKVEDIVRQELPGWQRDGLVPDMPIEPGDKTDEPIRTRGWTHWHHLFPARHLLYLALYMANSPPSPAMYLAMARTLNLASKLCLYNATGGNVGREPKIDHVFLNQAFNVMLNYGVRGSTYLFDGGRLEAASTEVLSSTISISTATASNVATDCDLFISDPPYADAVNYHEITEYFIAWLRKRAPFPFDQWIWDSRRQLAVKGDGEEFRHQMVAAYKAMADKMPDNGLQIVMFTHQSASVWADMSQIFWGSGLQVIAAWYIATETTSELKKGGYVQGTVILVLRKRESSQAGYKDEIVQEVKAEVADQIDTMMGLNQRLKGNGRVENLFEDADLQMAGYAAALRVLTKYEKIDGTDMTKEALRPRRAGEKNLVGEIIDFAVQVANEHMVPEHMPPKLWEGLTGPERFYFKMMDIETTSLRKLDNYQNFAKAFRVGDYGALMGSTEPNKARIKTAKEYKKTGFEIPEFGPSATRAVLFAIFEIEDDVEGDDVLSHLKDLLPSYHNKRDDLAAIADYIARKRESVDEAESRAARILQGLIRNERLG
jgi:putative DNA methylase